jgi:arabinose-5-phosphate isomerase
MSTPIQGDSKAAEVDVIETARRILQLESQSILAAAKQLDEQFTRAVHLIANSSEGARVIVSGLGKSGHVARKLAATFSSTGTPAVFLHAAEAAHGDIGVCRSGDVAILISKSGSTQELQTLVEMLRAREVSIIAITGSVNSLLARAADVALDGSVEGEADAHNLAPSCSTTVAMALGDALAFTVMQVRRLTEHELARNHPSGWIGRLMHTRVEAAMAQVERVAWVRRDDPMPRVLEAMTRCGLGCACVIGEAGILEGLITDGDVRRAVQRQVNIGGTVAAEIMTRKPITISPQASLYEAVRMMEDRPTQISVLPVVEEARCVGVIRLHDIHQKGLG